MHFRTSFAENICRNKYIRERNMEWPDLAATLVDDVCGTRGGTLAPILDKETRDELVKDITEMKFLPGGRYLYYAGRPFHAYNNCYLLKGEADTREEWGNIKKRASDCLMTGGGIGIDYSVFRPKGRTLSRTGGTSSGPLPLMQSINEIGRNVMQGGSRRCLPAGTFIHTDKGLVKIENVTVGTNVLTGKGYHKVTATLDQGEQATVTIHTQMGEFVCTPNHRVAVLTSIDGDYEWVEACNLRPEDRLFFVNESLPGIDTDFEAFEYSGGKSAMSTTLKDVTIPKLDTKQAWLLGYIHGNGYVKYDEKWKGHVAIAIPNSRPNIQRQALETLSCWCEGVTLSDGDGDVKVVKAFSVQLAEFFSTLKKPNQPIDVPEFILKGSLFIKSAYLAGLFDADGCGKTRPINAVCSVYKRFLQQVQAVYSSLGIVTRLTIVRKAKGNWKTLYSLSITGPTELTKFYMLVGSFALKEIQLANGSQRDYTVPLTMVRKHVLSSKVTKQSYKNVAIHLLEKVLGKLPYVPIEVKEVTNNDGLHHTYDIEVEGRNEFVAEGILVHNSAIYASLNWKHDDAHDFLKLKNWSEYNIGKARNKDGSQYTLSDAKRDDFNFPAPLDMTNISLNYDDRLYAGGDDIPETFSVNCRQALSTGEPGFSFNFGNQQNETLRNACVPGYVRILTPDGYFAICLFVEKETTTWNGEQWVKVTPKYTGFKPIYRITAEKNGRQFVLDCSDNHEFIVADGTRVLAEYLTPGTVLRNFKAPTTVVDKNVHNVNMVYGDGEEHEVKIVEVKYLEQNHTYCFNEPETHRGTFEGFVTGQCTEVTSEDDSDVCNLGSLNMARFDTLQDFLQTAERASKFLVCGTLRADLPYEKVYQVREKNRRLGLGLMGVHEWLLKRGKRYEVDDDLRSWLEAYRDGSESGANELCNKLGISKPVAYRAIAPTGTIGILAGTTTGIEPLFAVAYKRRYLTDGARWRYEYVVDATAAWIVNNLGVDPDKIETAADLANDYERRIKFQFEVQKYVDMSISSTINLPSWGSDLNNEDLVKPFAATLYKYAHGLRGFTCYPDGARGGQPLVQVPYSEAVKHKGTVFDEVDICEWTGKGGSCGA